MNDQSLHLQAPWDKVKEQLKEINTELTDEDLDYKPGHEDELLQRLSGILRKDPPEVRALIESVSANKGKAS